MKNTTIKIVNKYNSINIEALKKAILLIRGLRYTTAIYYQTSKNIAISNSWRETVKDVISTQRENIKRVYEQTGGPYVEVIRKLKSGEIFEVGYSPNMVNRQKAINDLRAKIKRFRENRKRIEYDRITNRKPGYYLRKYEQTVLEKFKKPLADDMARYVGIEIECILPEMASLKDLVPFGKYVSVSGDGSIQHDDNEIGKEIKVCVKREDVRDVVPKILDVLNGMGARVNKSCGLHVHLDQRHTPDASIPFQKLVRSLRLLYTVIPPSRRANRYCRRNRHGRFDVAARGNRYRAINASAYYKYKTIEVRLFGGTLDATKIINWIEVLHAIVDGAVMNRCPKNFDTARNHWQLSDENVTWLKTRQEKFGTVPSDTYEAQSDAVEVSLEMARALERETDSEDETLECGNCGEDHHTNDCEN